MEDRRLAEVAAAVQLRNDSEAWEDSILPLEEDEADDDKTVPTRKIKSVSQWKGFCDRVQQGKVKATCVIDFPYSDGGRWQNDDRSTCPMAVHGRSSALHHPATPSNTLRARLADAQHRGKLCPTGSWSGCTALKTPMTPARKAPVLPCALGCTCTHRSDGAIENGRIRKRVPNLSLPRM